MQIAKPSRETNPPYNEPPVLAANSAAKACMLDERPACDETVQFIRNYKHCSAAS